MANTSTAPPFKVKALFDYNSPHDDDLNFPADEIITVTEEEDDDWYYGEYTEKSSGALKQGIFPKNFVERIVVELPPRPTRSGGGRSKKPVEDPQEASPPTSTDPPRGPTVNTAAAAGSRPSTGSTVASPVAKEAPRQMEVRSPPRVAEEPRPAPVQQQQQERPTPASPPQAPKPAFTPKPPVPSNTEEKKPAGNKPPPPEKPSSFKDRLALFNKASAAPIAPYNPHKPPVNFIKKPFVAPPPSKNSYVPPPNQHVPKPKRDEDSNYIRAEPTEDTSRRSMEQERDKEEERPKLALKDRIALLQTQQLDPTGVSGGKPKRPPKPKRTESEQTTGEGNTEETTHSVPIQEEAGYERKSIDSSRDPEAEENEPAPRSKKSMDIGRDDHGRAESSAGDADASSIAEEPPNVHRPRPTTATREDKSDDGDDEGANDDTPDVPSDYEEEEVDPEVARKIALRERIAKMSGGMGMHGMFGPPMGIPMGGPPPAQPKKKKTPQKPSREDEDQPRRSQDGTEEVEERPMSSSSQAQQQQPVALPFALPRVQSPPEVERQQSDSENEEPVRDSVGTTRKISDEHSSDEDVDIEDIKSQPPQSPPQHPLGPRPMPSSPKAERPLPERVVPMSPPMLPQERPAPPPPPVPSERPAPPLPPTGQPLPPPAIEASPSEGSVSDDEMSAPPSKLSLATSEVDIQPRAAPPPPPPGAPSIPSGRPQSDAKSPTSPTSKRVSQGYFSPIGPPGSPPSVFNKRASYQRGAGGMPPVPGGIPLPPSAAPQQPPGVARPPPPPPPSGPPRRSIDDTRPGLSETSGSNRPSDTEEEVTEYEADYDTDIGNKVAHRDALKGKEHGKDEDDETPLPSPVISPQAPPRSVPPPPPPPGNPPPSRKGRQSVDMPRAAPPPVPPMQTQEQEQYDEDEYDPYKYDSPRYESPPPPAQPAMPPPPPNHQAPQERQPSRGGTSRQSLDVSRPPQSSGRRSMDQSRPSAEYVARDIDLGESTQWWKTPNTPPPIFQNRPRELYFEVEESTSSRRGGRTTITKDVYVLFHDYSQTIVTARYDREEPQNASLEQRHEAPPPQPRQDQLEDFQSKFGAKIYAGAKSREGSVVSGGDSEAFIRELLALTPGFLPPAGARAYGALVYANLANASVQQFDEIRPGDIITFRNAKFQGHKGGLHQKYSMEAGKPDHVAVVVDWDGTKKKLRAWEQGRESRKVKIESFKVADLRSGEVKVWRVVGRDWVGWGAHQ